MPLGRDAVVLVDGSLLLTPSEAKLRQDLHVRLQRHEALLQMLSQSLPALSSHHLHSPPRSSGSTL